MDQNVKTYNCNTDKVEFVHQNTFDLMEIKLTVISKIMKCSDDRTLRTINTLLTNHKYTGASLVIEKN